MKVLIVLEKHVTVNVKMEDIVFWESALVYQDIVENFVKLRFVLMIVWVLVNARIIHVFVMKDSMELIVRYYLAPKIAIIEENVMVKLENVIVIKDFGEMIVVRWHVHNRVIMEVNAIILMVNANV